MATQIKVWDVFIRIAHWTLVIATVLAYFSHGGLLTLHRIAGYTVIALVVARIAWGFNGGTYARFANFVPTPTGLARYLGLLLRHREPRTLGHNAAGGAMIVLLLIMLLAIGGTGWVLDSPAYRDYRPLNALHDGLSDVLMVLIAVHIAGVLHASWRHKENLIAAMITGRKSRR